MAKNQAAVQLGRKGGKATSEAKARAARENGKKGGRPKKIEVSARAAKEAKAKKKQKGKR